MKMRWRPKAAKTPRALEYDRIRRLVWPAVLRRAAFRCEGCGAQNVELQAAHLFGRRATGAGLGDWANCEHLMAALCTVHDGAVGCHERVDRHLDVHLAQRLRREALYRLSEAVEGRPTAVGQIRLFTGTLDEARRLVAELEASGWTYDAELQRPVQAT